MKKLFYLLALFTIFGMGKSWADTTYEYTNTPALNTDNFFTVAKGDGDASTYAVNLSVSLANGTTSNITKAVKMESATSITFTNSGPATVYVGLFARYAVEDHASNNQFKLDNTVYTAANATTVGSYEIVEISNLEAGTHSITRNSKEVEIYYVKVEEGLPAPSLSFQYGNTCQAEIPYNDNSTTILNALSGAPSGSTVTWSIVNAGTTGATVSNASGSEGYVTVSAPGSCVVRASTSATSSYAAGSADYTLTVTKQSDPSARKELSQFAFNVNEVVLHNGTSSYIYVNGTTFVYDETNRTLRAKLMITPDYTEIGAELNSTYFTVESSNPAVLNTANVSFRKPSDQRLYVDDIAVGTVSSDQNVTLTFRFLGSNTYEPAAIQVPIIIKAHNPVPYAGTQPYTWDFGNNDWTTSKLQLNYGYSIWTADENEARPTSATVINANNGIDMIQGLAFTTTSAASLCLDYANKQLWLATDATIAIPDLTVGQTVTITTTNGNNFAIAGDGTATGTIAGNVITVTTAGTLKIRITAPTYIKSIAVANAVQAPYTGEYTYTTTALYDDEDDTTVERPTTGTYTFKTAGSIAGGTVLNEIPGLSVTVGAAGEDTWSVVVANTLDGSYNLGDAALYCSAAPNRYYFTTGNFVVFNPTVNGSIKVRYYTTSRARVAVNGSPVYDTGSGSTRIQEYSFNVIAGKQYVFSTETSSLYVNSISFTPMFFDPVANNAYAENSNLIEASHDQSNPFVATSDTPTNMFPKMIVSDAQAGTARFAGNKSVVYLYNNNNVELIGYSDHTILRGRVYAAAPNDDRQLNAWYWLRSNVLQLASTKINSTDITDKEYIDNPGGSSNNYVFTFNQNIALAPDAVITVRKDAADAQTVTATVSGADLLVPLGELENGVTYTITIKAASVDSSEDANVTTAEITRIFTVNNDGELTLDMIYPTTIATVGTRIVLKSQLMDDTSKTVVIDKNYPEPDKNSPYYHDDMTGNLVGNLYKIENGAEVWVEDIVADYSNDKISFKPSQTLDANSTYTLIVSANLDQDPQYQVKGSIEGTVYYVKHDKAFTFKTGTVSGTAPIMSSSSPYDGQRCTITQLPVDNPTFTVTFDQNIDIEDGTIINVRPVNGSEANTKGYFYKLTEEFGASSITVSGNQLTINGGSEALRYDLWHELVIPAGCIIGTGGTPNTSEIKIKFKVDKNPAATQEVSYPYTWDFNRMSAQSINTSMSDIDESATYFNTGENYKLLGAVDGYRNAMYKQGTSYYNYNKRRSNMGLFDQGNNVYVTIDGEGTKKYLNEFQGLRISLKKAQNPRFEINEYGTNADGSTRYQFSMIGNTHYFTIPDVPKGDLYVNISTNAWFAINSPNAYFDYDNSDSRLTHLEGDNTVITKTPSDCRIKIVVTQAGDVSFCVKNFRCNQIAVPIVTDKYISAVGYATDSWSVPVRYDLTNTLTGTPVTGMFIKSADDQGNAYDTNSTVVKLSPVKSTLNGELKDNGPKVATAGAGTILKGSQGSYALFTADVNSLPDNTMDEGATPNLLIGNSDKSIIVGNSDGSTNDYIFSNVYYSVNQNGEIVDGTQYQGLGFRLVAAGLSEADRTLAPHKSYLHLPTGAAAAAGATPVAMMLLDFDNNVLNAIRDIPATDNADGEQNDDAYYTLSGIKVDKPTQKGIYIRNGKKYFVK